jgi:hypothetical protein
MGIATPRSRRADRRVYTEVMLRRAIAAVVIVMLTMLVLPCGFAAGAQHAPHACCAPAVQASAADCCNSAAPHPATAPASGQSQQASLEDLSSGLPQLAKLRTASFVILAQTQPAKRIPATIIRT